MSDVTNEDIAEIRGLLERSVKTWESINAYKAAIDKLDSMARELLTRRQAEEAVDDEVERITNEIIYQLQTDDIIKLRDIAISRGQQIREKYAEIERLKNGNDELRQSYEFIVSQKDRRIDALQSELASLKSATVEEVESLLSNPDLESEEIEQKLADLARTFAQQRDEAMRIVNPIINIIMDGGDIGIESNPHKKQFLYLSICDGKRRLWEGSCEQQLGMTEDLKHLLESAVNSLKLVSESGVGKCQKCGDPEEWPEDLRIREFPEVK